MSTVRFLADEDLRAEIVHATRRLEPGIEIVIVRNVGLAGFSDEQVLEYATEHGWLVLSHDVNTLKGLAEARLAASMPTTGVFLIPQSRATRPIAESLVLIWSGSEAEEWGNRIVYLPL